MVLELKSFRIKIDFKYISDYMAFYFNLVSLHCGITTFTEVQDVSSSSTSGYFMQFDIQKGRYVFMGSAQDQIAVVRLQLNYIYHSCDIKARGSRGTLCALCEKSFLSSIC